MWMLIDRAAARFTRDRDLHGPQPETLPIRSPSRTRRQFFEEERIEKVLNSPAPSSVCLLPAEISPVGSEVDLSGEWSGVLRGGRRGVPAGEPVAVPPGSRSRSGSPSPVRRDFAVARLAGVDQLRNAARLLPSRDRNRLQKLGPQRDLRATWKAVRDRDRDRQTGSELPGAQRTARSARSPPLAAVPVCPAGSPAVALPAAPAVLPGLRESPQLHGLSAPGTDPWTGSAGDRSESESESARQNSRLRSVAADCCRPIRSVWGIRTCSCIGEECCASEPSGSCSPQRDGPAERTAALVCEGQRATAAATEGTPLAGRRALGVQQRRAGRTGLALSSQRPEHSLHSTLPLSVTSFSTISKSRDSSPSSLHKLFYQVTPVQGCFTLLYIIYVRES